MDLSVTRYFLKNWFEGIFFSLQLNMNKTFSKSYIIPPLELTLDYIVMNNCLQDITFISAEDSFIRVTRLHDRRLTAPNITAWLNQ